MRPLDIDTDEGMSLAARWQESMLSTVRQGGSWAVPRSQSIYQIDHKNKVAKKLCGKPEPSIERVFNEIGWTVK